MGHVAEAKLLRKRTQSLIIEKGFQNIFILSMAPGGGDSFTWTAAVWLAWASPSNEVLMGSIELSDIEKWFGEAQVIKGIDLNIKLVSSSFLLAPLVVANQHY